MANLTDADKVLRNDTGKDIVTQLTAIKTAIENGGGGGGSGASTVSQLTDVLLSQNIPDGDVLVRDNNLTGGKLWKNATITVELTQAEYNQLVADDDVLPDVNYYITDAPSMQGTSADLSYDGTTKSTYTKIGEIDTALSGKQDTLTYESDDYNVATYGGVIRCKKWGRMVNIQGYSIGTSQTIPTGQALTLATIASKYRPSVQQHIMGTSNTGSYKYDNGQFYRINTDGTVVIYVYAGTSFLNGNFNVTFII